MIGDEVAGGTLGAFPPPVLCRCDPWRSHSNQFALCATCQTTALCLECGGCRACAKRHHPHEQDAHNNA
jgi:hypothetical protein